jgi:flagellar biosynthesis protein FlhF
MMQVKKYRAATTREALEQIKNDLGQDAFVLETKQVKKSGLFGLGRSATEIEISAAAAPLSQTPQKNETQNPAAAVTGAARSSAAAPQMLFLRDDTVASPAAPVEAAAPAFPAAQKMASDDLMSILAAKGFSANENDSEWSERAGQPYSLNSIFAARPAQFETAEISSEAPQFVHPKKETVTASATEQEFIPAQPAGSSAAATAIDSSEFEFLRAELREVKFALGKIAFRNNAAEYQKDIDLDFLGGNYDSPFHEAYIELATLGVPSELAKNIVLEIIPELRGSISSEKDIARLALTSALSSRLTFAASPLQPDGDRILAFVGPTGVGKTTTIAKLAARVALQQGRRVELIALDTYRIGAVEQLRTYAEIIGAGCHTVRSVLELDAMLRKLPQDATILVDSTGKSPHDLADQYTLAEYLRHNDEIKKCLVLQANTHPVDAASAVRKFKIYGPDYLAVTKFDETERPGALLEVAAESTLPLAYFCMGQRVPEDLQEATLGNMVSRILPKNS